MSDPRESLSSFVDKIEPTSAYDRILGKNVLVAPSEEQYDLLLKRLKQQVGEGRGEVILEVNMRFPELQSCNVLYWNLLVLIFIQII